MVSVEGEGMVLESQIPWPWWDHRLSSHLSSQPQVLLVPVPTVCHRWQRVHRLTYTCLNRLHCCARALLGTRFNNHSWITGAPTVPILGYVFWRFLGELGRRGR